MSCFDAMKAALKKSGIDVTDKEAEALAKKYDAERKAQKILRSNAEFEADIDAEVAAELGQRIIDGIKVEKRNAYLMAKKRLEFVDFVTTNFADDYALGVEAILSGVNTARNGSKKSIASVARSLELKYLSRLFNDLNAAGLTEDFKSGAFDKEIFDAIYRLEREQDLTGLPDEAIQIGRILSETTESLRLAQNRVGALIDKYAGYVMRQSHDMQKIKKVSAEEYKNFLREKLDLERVIKENNLTDKLDPDSPNFSKNLDKALDDFLQGVYNALSTGVHIKEFDVSTERPKTYASLAAKLGASRKLHFKDGAAAYEYNKQFGQAYLSEGVIRGIAHSAQAIALLERMGPNPEFNFNAVQKVLLQKAPVEQHAEIQKAFNGKLKYQFAELTGVTRIAHDLSVAKFNNAVRAVANMASLGATSVLQVAELANAMSEMRYQGGNIFETISGQIKQIVSGRRLEKERELITGLQAFFDGYTSNIAMRYDGGADDISGTITKMQTLFFRLNFQSYLTDTMRYAAHKATAAHFTAHMPKGYADLSPEFKRAIGLYGIDETMWGVLQQMPRNEFNGIEYLFPERVSELSDEVIKGYIKSRPNAPKKVSNFRLQEARDEIERAVSTFYSNRADIAILNPSLRGKGFLRRGTQSGTFTGELMRYAGQLKGFATAYTMEIMGRELYGRTGKEAFMGMGFLIFSTTIAGYIAMTLQDLLRGREPQDPSKPQTIVAAMLKGGGLGFYGDMVLGDLNKFIEGLPGPVFGRVVGLATDFTEQRNKFLAGEEVEFKATAFNKLVQSIPGNNLFYVRLPLDYAILWSAQEALSPGTLRKMEKRLKDKNGQEMWLRPTRDRLRTLEDL